MECACRTEAFFVSLGGPPGPSHTRDDKGRGAKRTLYLRKQVDSLRHLHIPVGQPAFVVRDQR
jgi:hypothetical protein